ncbi:MAG: YdeI family protein [Terriglobia bacterium]
MRTLSVKDRGKWRAWLERNAATETEIWLVQYRKGTGPPQVPYADAVEEAICFGWIDGKIRKLDALRFAQRFTPRKPNSNWSPTNIERARRMIREGKMTAAGLMVFDPRNRTPPLPAKLPAALKTEFQKHRTAWENFQRFTPSYQRMTIGWVASAKKEETRLRRLRQLIAHSAANQRIEFM